MNPSSRSCYGQVDGYDQDYINSTVPIIKRWTHSWFRAQILGLDNLPNSAFLGVGNHSGSVLIPDTYIWLSHYHMLKRKPNLLALTHPGIFELYPRRMVRALSKMGAIRANGKNAYKAFEQGHAVQIYPGGDRDACRPFYKGRQIEFNGQTNYVRLAQRAKVPIVPIVSIGAHRSLCILSDGRHIARALKLDKLFGLQALPVSLCVPWGLTIGPIPYLPLPVKVTLRVLEPIDPSGSVEKVDAYVQSTMNAILSKRKSLQTLESSCDA